VVKGWSLKSEEEMNRVRQMAESFLPIGMEPAELVSMASFFKGLADETRLKIVSLLWLGDLCMCEIVAALSGASSTISHHLKIMEIGGLITTRREGKFTIYRLNKEKLTHIIPYVAKE
jgi:ArsR family transcriptional regulator, lead/cadmium/zinc/bismuth-responsive transcriptional repressor